MAHTTALPITLNTHETMNSDSEASTASPILFSECLGCSDNMENQQAHYQGPDNPHGCIPDPDGGGCDAEEWQDSSPEVISDTEFSDASETSPPMSTGTSCRMQHVLKRAKHKLFDAKQKERRATMVLDAVQKWCDSKRIAQSAFQPINVENYDSDVECAARVLISMAVPLRFMSVCQRDSLQKETLDPLLGMFY